ncbi:MAG: amidoligase family protein [Coprococcus sp.]
MIKNQLFGVEVEMTGITREKAARLVAEVLGTVPSHPESNCYHTRTIADRAARKWKIMRDSSITPIRNDDTIEPLDEYRVEFVTPPLNYSDIELLQNIIRKLRENGAKAHSSCGIHIHVDGANHTAVSLRRLVNFMTARQDLIYEALQIGDRESNWCHKLNKTLLDAMKKDKNLTKEKAEEIWYSRANDGYCGGIDHQHYNATRYHGVNLHSFFTKGTVEFRLFNSTLHAGKIKAYIQFCLAVSAWAITSQEKLYSVQWTDTHQNRKLQL